MSGQAKGQEMDIEKHMKALIGLEELDRLGGSYVGTIKDVRIETLNNKKKGRQDKAPVITFKETDHYYVPNEGNKKTLRNEYGQETDLWIGKRIKVYIAEMVGLTGEETFTEGEDERVLRREKVVECLDAPLAPPLNKAKRKRRPTAETLARSTEESSSPPIQERRGPGAGLR